MASGKYICDTCIKNYVTLNNFEKLFLKFKMNIRYIVALNTLLRITLYVNVLLKINISITSITKNNLVNNDVEQPKHEIFEYNHLHSPGKLFWPVCHIHQL